MQGTKWGRGRWNAMIPAQDHSSLKISVMVGD